MARHADGIDARSGGARESGERDRRKQEKREAGEEHRAEPGARSLSPRPAVYISERDDGAAAMRMVHGSRWLIWWITGAEVVLDLKR